MRTFSQGRDFIYVDPKVIDAARAWLSKLQNKDGCIKSVGKLFHNEMKVERDFLLNWVPQLPVLHNCSHNPQNSIDLTLEIFPNKHSYPVFCQGGVRDEVTLTAYVTNAFLELNVKPSVSLISAQSHFVTSHFTSFYNPRADFLCPCVPVVVKYLYLPLCSRTTWWVNVWIVWGMRWRVKLTTCTPRLWCPTPSLWLETL